MKRFLLGIAVLIGTSVSGGFAGETPRQTEIYKAAVDSDGVQRVSVLGGGYFFTPNHVILKAGVPVELSVKKEPGMVPHSFVIKAPEAGMEIEETLATDAKTIKFTPGTPGRYVFYCKEKLLFFASHREKGMEGVLEVVE